MQRSRCWKRFHVLIASARWHEGFALWDRDRYWRGDTTFVSSGGVEGDMLDSVPIIWNEPVKEEEDEEEESDSIDSKKITSGKLSRWDYWSTPVGIWLVTVQPMPSNDSGKDEINSKIHQMDKATESGQAVPLCSTRERARIRRALGSWSSARAMLPSGQVQGTFVVGRAEDHARKVQFRWLDQIQGEQMLEQFDSRRRNPSVQTRCSATASKLFPHCPLGTEEGGN